MTVHFAATDFTLWVIVYEILCSVRNRFLQCAGLP